MSKIESMNFCGRESSERERREKASFPPAFSFAVPSLPAAGEPALFGRFFML
jgi:hypothetical protein